LTLIPSCLFHFYVVYSGFHPFHVTIIIDFSGYKLAYKNIQLFI